MPGGEAALNATMTLRVAILGDSIGYGTGATRTADTLAPRLTADLHSIGLVTESRVFAVPGARSDDLPPQVTRVTAWQPDLAVIVIGANDLAGLVPAERSAAHLGQAVRRLREAGAQVVVAPAPDLSIVPFVPPAAFELLRTASTELRRPQAAVVLTEGGRVADPDGETAAAFAADRRLFSADGFHPSSAGYAAIARALGPAVLAAAREVHAIDQAG